MSDRGDQERGMQDMEALWHGRKGDKGDKGDPGMAAGARNAVAFLLILTLVLAAANLLFTQREVDRVRMTVHASCKFDGDIGSVPLSVNPATGKPSPLGITIIVDARQAWHQLGCPGKIPAASPSFLRWARYYHLTGY